MPMPDQFADRLALPLIGAPTFISSCPERVVVQCKAGTLGTSPALSTRTSEMPDDWRVREDAGAVAQPPALC